MWIVILGIYQIRHSANISKIGREKSGYDLCIEVFRISVNVSF